MDRLELLDRDPADAVEGAVLLLEDLAHVPAEVVDPERAEEDRERDLRALLLDLLDQLGGELGPDPLQGEELLLVEPVEVRRGLEHARVVGAREQLVPEAEDVERGAVVGDRGDHRAPARLRLGAVEEVLLLPDRAAAGGADRGEGDLRALGPGGRRLGHELHVRDHAAAAGHHQLRARRLAEQPELVDEAGVVERGAPDLGAREGDRLDQRDRRDRARAGDAPLHRRERGGARVALELVGHRVAGVVRGGAEPPLLVEAVGLEDHAVDLVVERAPPAREELVALAELLLGGELEVDRREAERLEPLHLPLLGLDLRRDQIVGAEGELVVAATRGVLVLDRAGGEVARVRELPREAGEDREPHVDLAAHLDPLGRGQALRSLELLRDVGDGPRVRGQVLADGAAAPGGGERQPALVVVAQAASDPVHLRRHDHLALELLRPGEEVLVAVALVEGEHRPLVVHLLAGRGGRAEVLERGRVGPELSQPVDQAVVLVVRDLGLGLVPVELVVVSDRGLEILGAHGAELLVGVLVRRRLRHL